MRRLIELMGRFAMGELPPAAVRAVLHLYSEAVARSESTSKLSAIETGRREEEIGTWLEEHDVANPWDLPPTLVSAGLDRPWLDTVVDRVGPMGLSGALNCVADIRLITALLDQIDDATSRISALVAAVKGYSSMDRSPEAEIDIHDGIEKTLMILGHKLRTGIQIVRDYDDDLPRFLGDGDDLNQVWTNLVDNAIDAWTGTARYASEPDMTRRPLSLRSSMGGRGFPVISHLESLTRSLPPKRRARGLGWDSISHGGSWSTAVTVRYRCSRHRAKRVSPSGCRTP